MAGVCCDNQWTCVYAWPRSVGTVRVWTYKSYLCCHIHGYTLVSPIPESGVCCNLVEVFWRRKTSKNRNKPCVFKTLDPVCVHTLISAEMNTWTIDFEESQYWCGWVSTHDVTTVKSVSGETPESSRLAVCCSIMWLRVQHGCRKCEIGYPHRKRQNCFVWFKLKQCTVAVYCDFKSSPFVMLETLLDSLRHAGKPQDKESWRFLDFLACLFTSLWRN